MTSKKTFITHLQDSPTSKFLSGQTEERGEHLNTPEPEARTEDELKKTAQQDEPAKEVKTETNQRKKEVKGQRFSLLLTNTQREQLDKIAIVRGVSVNELISIYINDGIRASRDDLDKWERIKEVLG